ncbi:hypothetical protein JL721_12314 [Aureococcus anophagefferens]|nr:hypothetical protein JL721_12314 [Aureococcus anophagefferens]
MTTEGTAHQAARLFLQGWVGAYRRDDAAWRDFVFQRASQICGGPSARTAMAPGVSVFQDLDSAGVADALRDIQLHLSLAPIIHDDETRSWERIWNISAWRFGGSPFRTSSTSYDHPYPPDSPDTFGRRLAKTVVDRGHPFERGDRSQAGGGGGPYRVTCEEYQHGGKKRSAFVALLVSAGTICTLTLLALALVWKTNSDERQWARLLGDHDAIVNQIADGVIVVTRDASSGETRVQVCNNAVGSIIQGEARRSWARRPSTATAAPAARPSRPFWAARSRS